MSLKKQIAEDFMTAFKARTEEGTKKKNILGLLKAEITKAEQHEDRTTGELNDEEVMNLIKASVKNANKTLVQAEKSAKQDMVDELNFEIEVLEVYLPKKMTEEEIDSKIKEAVDGGANNIGQIMGAFKGLEVDKKLVSQKAQSQLTN